MHIGGNMHDMQGRIDDVDSDLGALSAHACT